MFDLPSFSLPQNIEYLPIKLGNIFPKGLPKNRIITIYGPEASGKSFLGYNILRNAQALGVVALVDSEYAYSTKYLQTIGIDTSRLLVLQSPVWQDIKDFILKVQATCPVIVLDSLAGLAESFDINTNDNSGLLRFVALSQFFNSIRLKATIIVLDQVRENPQEHTQVSTAQTLIQAYSSIIIRVDGGGIIKEHDLVVGKKITAAVEFNNLEGQLTKDIFEVRNDKRRNGIKS